jgi:outer membrane protein assembly factor BamB
VVSDEWVIAFHRQDNHEVLEAFDAHTGTSLWQHAYGTAYVDPYGFNNGPRSAPTLAGDHVYSFGAEGVLSCLKLTDGTRVWQREVNREFGVPQTFFGAGVSPVLAGDRILINVGATNGAGIVAFDRLTGRTAWQATGHEASYSTPVTAEIGDRQLAVFLTRNGLVVLESNTGNVIGEYAFRAKKHESVNAASPLVLGDRIFISASYRVGAALLEIGRQGLKEVWRNPEAMRNHWATSIHHEGYVYGYHGRHENSTVLRCISLNDGKVQWDGPPGLGRSTAIMAEGHLIVVGERGDLALIEVNPDRYIEKARARLFNYPAWAPPALAGGLLYVRDETQLVCIDLRR